MYGFGIKKLIWWNILFGGGGGRDLENLVNVCVLIVGLVVMNWMSIVIDVYVV